MDTVTVMTRLKEVIQEKQSSWHMIFHRTFVFAQIKQVRCNVLISEL